MANNSTLATHPKTSKESQEHNHNQCLHRDKTQNTKTKVGDHQHPYISIHLASTVLGLTFLSVDLHRAFCMRPTCDVAEALVWPQSHPTMANIQLMGLYLCIACHNGSSTRPPPLLGSTTTVGAQWSCHLLIAFLPHGRGRALCSDLEEEKESQTTNFSWQVERSRGT